MDKNIEKVIDIYWLIAKANLDIVKNPRKIKFYLKKRELLAEEVDEVLSLIDHEIEDEKFQKVADLMEKSFTVSDHFIDHHPFITDYM